MSWIVWHFCRKNVICGGQTNGVTGISVHGKASATISENSITDNHVGALAWQGWAQISRKYGQSEINQYFFEDNDVAFANIHDLLLLWLDTDRIYASDRNIVFARLSIFLLNLQRTKVLKICVRKRKWDVWKRMGVCLCVTDAHECIRMHMTACGYIK